MIHGIERGHDRARTDRTPIWRKSAAQPLRGHAFATCSPACPTISPRVKHPRSRERVADAVMTALTARRPRTRYAVMRNPLVPIGFCRACCRTACSIALSRGNWGCGEDRDVVWAGRRRRFRERMIDDVDAVWGGVKQTTALRCVLPSSKPFSLRPRKSSK